jgi:hypothetical protein
MPSTHVDRWSMRDCPSSQVRADPKVKHPPPSNAPRGLHCRASLLSATLSMNQLHDVVNKENKRSSRCYHQWSSRRRRRRRPSRGARMPNVVDSAMTTSPTTASSARSRSSHVAPRRTALAPAAVRMTSQIVRSTIRDGFCCLFMVGWVAGRAALAGHPRVTDHPAPGRRDAASVRASRQRRRRAVGWPAAHTRSRG